jgi:transposase
MLLASRIGFNKLLLHCGRYPEPKSILVMDNASFHRTDRIQQMCDARGVKLIYLPPYSPDLNPVEEFFAELKSFIKKQWDFYARNSELNFDTFLEWCVEQVGSRVEHARGHFRNSGWTIDEPSMEKESPA